MPMQLFWTNKASSDLVRLYDFLALINQPAAASIMQALTNAPIQLLQHPYFGQKVEGFGERDVRRILVNHYELRYEIDKTSIYILRIWHTRENR